MDPLELALVAVASFCIAFTVASLVTYWLTRR